MERESTTARRSLPIIELTATRTEQVRIAPVVHAVRVVVLVLFAIGLWRWSAVVAARSGQAAPVVIDIGRVVSLVPGAASIEPMAESPDGFDPSAYRVFDDQGNPIAVVTQTSPDSDRIVGYSGPSNALVVMDNDFVVTSVHLLRCGDTPDHLKKVVNRRAFWDQFVGWKWGQTASVRVDGVSGATLTSLGIAEGVAWRLSRGPGEAPAELPTVRRSLRFPDVVAPQILGRWFRGAAEVVQSPDQPYRVEVRDAHGAGLGEAFRSGPLDDSEIGFQGPSEVYFRLGGQNLDTQASDRKALRDLGLDGETVVADWILATSFDNEPYVGYVKQESSFWKRFRGRSIASLAQMDLDAEEIDGVSGATMTSIAIARTIRGASRTIMDLALDAAENETPADGSSSVEPESATDASVRSLRINASAGEWMTAILGIAALFWGRSQVRGRRLPRLIWQVTALVIIGLVSGNLLSVALLGGWTRGGVAWRLAPGLATLAAIAIFAPAIFKGNVYCDHLCPHGIVQQWVRPLKRRAIPAWLSAGLRVSAVVLILLTFVSVVFPTGLNLAWFEPFDAYAAGVVVSVSVVLWGVSLVLARMEPMGYCRLACPTGKLLDYVRRDASRHRITTPDIGLASATVILWALIALA
jgi:NosR/NirI family transcriptional regulator, nitrous oxide reductase regulator